MPARAVAALPALAFLAACGGATESGPPPPPPSVAAMDVRLGTPDAEPSTPRPFFDAATNRFIILAPSRHPSNIGVPRILAGNVDPSISRPPGFALYGLTDGPDAAVRALTASGAGEAHAIRRGNVFDAPGGLERGHRRLGPTVLPASGRAEYAGGYMGVLADAGDLDPAGVITGALTLAVDFGDASVSGRISGRETNGGMQFADFVIRSDLARGGFLNPADGSFAGVSAGEAGGQQTRPGVPNTVATGAYSGLIVGPDGREVVGGLNLTHSVGGTMSLIEYGVFAGAAAPPP